MCGDRFANEQLSDRGRSGFSLLSVGVAYASYSVSWIYDSSYFAGPSVVLRWFGPWSVHVRLDYRIGYRSLRCRNQWRQCHLNQRWYVGEAYSNNQRPRDVLLRKRNPGSIPARHREEWFQ